MKYFFIICSIIFFISCNRSGGRNKNYDYELADFNIEVKNDLESSSVRNNKASAIKSIKMYNTIFFYNLQKEKLFKQYIEYFERNQDSITSVLKCGFGLGLTKVCEDSLNIGSYFSRKSIFKLNTEPPKDGRQRIFD